MKEPKSVFCYTRVSLGLAKVPQNDIRKIVGCSIGRVNSILKYLPKSKGVCCRLQQVPSRKVCTKVSPSSLTLQSFKAARAIYERHAPLTAHLNSWMQRSIHFVDTSPIYNQFVV